MANKGTSRLWARFDRLQQPFWITVIEWGFVIVLVTALAVVVPAVPPWSAGPIGSLVVGSSMWWRTRPVSTAPMTSLPSLLPLGAWAVADIPGSWVVIRTNEMIVPIRSPLGDDSDALLVGIVVRGPGRSRVWRLI